MAVKPAHLIPQVLSSLVFDYMDQPAVPAAFGVIKKRSSMLYRNPPPEYLRHRVDLFLVEIGAGHVVTAFVTDKPDSCRQVFPAGHTYIGVNQPQDVPENGEEVVHGLMFLKV
jgi:hypothetical protein